jgi:uncharacterized protein YdcH (DUF465 family)
MTSDPLKSGFNREVGKTAHETITRQRGDRLIERANTHFEKQSGAWINKRYGELLKSKAAPAPELTPHGGRESAGHKAHKAALLDVHNRHQSRIIGIHQKVDRVIKNQGQGQEKLQKQAQNRIKKNEIAR